MIAATNLTFDIDADGGSDALTASISPTSNRLLLASVSSRTGITAEPNEPTLSGNGLTWVSVASIYWDTDSSSRKKTTVFRALGASPSAEEVTIDFGGQAQTHVAWCIDEFSGIDTGGTNGSAAIVQAVTGKDEVSGGGTLTVTLAAFGSADNATYGAFSADVTTTGATAGTGFTELANAISSMNNMSEFRSDNDTSVTADYETAAGFKIGGIAIEIKAAAVGTVVKDIIGGGIVPFPR